MAVIQQMLIGIGAANRVYATFDPAHSGGGIVLSNGNLTATMSGTSQNYTISNIGKSAGKWYWEFLISTLNWSAGTLYVGCGNTADLGGGPGYTLPGVGWVDRSSSSTSQTYINNIIITTGLSQISQGNVIGFALDADAKTMSFYLNNSLICTESAIGAGAVYASAAMYRLTAGAVVANFGASAFTYSAPSGFNSGLYQ